MIPLHLISTTLALCVAVAHAALGNLDAAAGEFEEATTRLLDRGQWREAMSVTRDWAKALRRAGRDEEAYAVLERATSFSRHKLSPE